MAPTTLASCQRHAHGATRYGTYATTAPNASNGFLRMTSVKLVLRMTYQARLESDLMACQSMPLSDGDGFGVCPALLPELSEFWSGGAVDLKRHWVPAGTMRSANGFCCRRRADVDCSRRTTRGTGRVEGHVDGTSDGDVVDVHCRGSRNAPAGRRPAALKPGIVKGLGRLDCWSID